MHAHIAMRDIFRPNFAKSDKKKLKVLSCRFKQRLEPFSMLTVEGFSETGFFTHLSKHVFHTP